MKNRIDCLSNGGEVEVFVGDPGGELEVLATAFCANAWKKKRATEF